MRTMCCIEFALHSCFLLYADSLRCCRSHRGHTGFIDMYKVNVAGVCSWR